MFKKLVKRNKGVSIATAAAVAVLMVVVGVFLKINYDARVEAENKNGLYETEKDLKLKEQADKRRGQKESAPTFVRAAKLLTTDKKFANALTQVDTALEYDADQTDAFLLRGQLLLGLERYDYVAAGPLAEYLRRKTRTTRRPVSWRNQPKPEPHKAAYLLALNEIFQQQKAFALAGHMTNLAERFLGPMRERLPLYRKRIDADLPGLGNQLSLDEKGNLHLDFFQRGPHVRDLRCLKGIPLSSLNIGRTMIEELDPLRGMPLTRLSLTDCLAIKDLEPLKGMKLTYLQATNLPNITTLEPLSGDAAYPALHDGLRANS